MKLLFPGMPRHVFVCSSGWIIVICLIFLSLFGQMTCAAEETSKKWEPPSPPSEIAALIKLGKVRFDFYDASAVRKQWPGTTHFEFKFKYIASYNHHIESVPAGQMLVVEPRFRSITPILSHRIELPETYRTDDFWKRPLVLHEFDHVRISSHPYWFKQFEKRVRGLTRVTDRWPEGTPAADSPVFAKQIVDEAVRKVFNETLSLLEIRYKELDRLTEHGLRPLAESDLKGIFPQEE